MAIDHGSLIETFCLVVPTTNSSEIASDDSSWYLAKSSSVMTEFDILVKKGEEITTKSKGLLVLQGATTCSDQNALYSLKYQL